MTKFQRLTAARRTGVAAALAVALAGVLTIGHFVVAAFAVPVVPAPVITGSPPDPSTSTSATFTFKDSQPGVSFRCALDSASFAACTSGISYANLAGGNHTFRVQAVSRSKNSEITSYSWAVVPPTPVIVNHPANPTTATTASFTYTDAQSGVSFQCSLDGSGFSNCPSAGISYTHLASGSHTFMVEARHGPGPPSSPASYTWQVGAAVNFTVGGNLTSPLYPGTSEPLNLTFTNPNSFPITISSGAVAAGNITVTANQAGCAGSNFAVVQGLTVSVTIPAHQLTPESLSALGVAQGNWPVIKMIDTNANQDACEGATLTLTYSGIEATG